MTTGTDLPSGITIDFLRSQLIWGDKGSGMIVSSGMDGTEQTALVSGQGDKPFRVGVHGNYVIWTSEGGTEYNLVDRTDGSRATLTVITKSGETPALYGLVVLSGTRRNSEGMQLSPFNINDSIFS